MKKIYIFKHYATPPNLPGGRRHYNMACAIGENGYMPFIFVSNFSHSTMKFMHKVEKLFCIEQYGKVKFVWLDNKPAYYGNDLRRIANMLCYSVNAYRATMRLKKTGVVPDLVIGSVAHIFAVISAYAVSKKTKARFWIDVGDLWPEGYVQAGALDKNSPISKGLSLLSRFLYGRAEKIIVLTNKTKNYLVTLGVRESKIIVLPNGLIREELQNVPTLIERNKNDILTVTYAGSFGKIYPIEELLEAICMLSKKRIRVKCNIIGNGQKRVLIKEKIEKYNMKDINVFGPIKKEELQNYYAHTDVLMVLEKNVQYGFPNKVIDYALSGKPIIIASDSYYDLPEKIFMKIRPEASEIKTALEKFADFSMEYRRNLGEKAKEYVIEHFDMKKNYNQYILPYL